MQSNERMCFPSSGGELSSADTLASFVGLTPEALAARREGT